MRQVLAHELRLVEASEVLGLSYGIAWSSEFNTLVLGLPETSHTEVFSYFESFAAAAFGVDAS